MCSIVEPVPHVDTATFPTKRALFITANVDTTVQQLQQTKFGITIDITIDITIIVVHSDGRLFQDTVCH